MKRSIKAMKTSITIKIIALSALFISVNTAFGHDGYAMQDAHWHATDAWGFAILGIAVATALWMLFGSK